MMLIDVVKIPVAASLAVVVAILALTMVLSVRTAPRITPRESSPDPSRHEA
jgi:tellurite resistance protein TerC